MQDLKAADLHAARGVALREFELSPGHGTADDLLYVDGKACGVVEAKKQGATLTGVEAQSGRYAQGLPDGLPAWRRPLPFVYESTGVETHFTSVLDPAPRARPVFAFHRAETLADWLAQAAAGPPGVPATVLTTSGDPPPAEARRAEGGTMRARLQAMPPLVTTWGDFKLWPAQITAIHNLERSLAQNKPRALIQMATGSGKTFTAIGFIYRLIKFGGARRVLFLVDRGNLGRKTSTKRPKSWTAACRRPTRSEPSCARCATAGRATSSRSGRSCPRRWSSPRTTTTRDTLFPLQGHLGYEITQSLFIGKNTLLVEGPSDILFLTAFSQELKRRARLLRHPQALAVNSPSVDVALGAFEKVFVAINALTK